MTFEKPARRVLPVNFPAMPDLHHEHGVLNLIDDTVIPGAHAVKLALALQLHAPRRARLGGEVGQGFAEAAQQSRVAQAGEILPRLPLKRDLAGHSRTRPPPVRRSGYRVPL